MITEEDIDPFKVAPFIRHRFKSFKRFLIYFFYKQEIIDLRTKPSEDYSIIELLKIVDLLIQQIEPKQKFNKSQLWEMLGIDDETFKSRFEDYLIEKGLENKRKFTLEQVFDILAYNQGQGDWADSDFINKNELASRLYGGKPNYKKLRAELECFLSEEELNMNKIPIRTVKEFINHIEITAEEQETIFKFKKREFWHYLGFSLLYIVFVERLARKLESENRTNK